MDIQTLLRDDSPEDQPFRPKSYQLQPTTNNARPSSLSAHTGLHNPDLPYSQSDNFRDQVQSSQKGLASSLLNSNPPLAPRPRTMDDVSQDVYADVDPEVVEAAKILIMMSNGWNEEGANNKRRESTKSENEQQGPLDRDLLKDANEGGVHTQTHGIVLLLQNLGEPIPEYR